VWNRDRRASPAPSTGCVRCMVSRRDVPDDILQRLTCAPDTAVIPLLFRRWTWQMCVPVTFGTCRIVLGVTPSLSALRWNAPASSATRSCLRAVRQCGNEVFAGDCSLPMFPRGNGPEPWISMGVHSPSMGCWSGFGPPRRARRASCNAWNCLSVNDEGSRDDAFALRISPSRRSKCRRTVTTSTCRVGYYSAFHRLHSSFNKIRALADRPQ
jgi:hypothetical protein